MQNRTVTGGKKDHILAKIGGMWQAFPRSVQMYTKSARQYFCILQDFAITLS